LLPEALFAADKAEGEKLSEPERTRTTDNAARRKKIHEYALEKGD
jgi:hypothetical protein